MGWSTFIYIEHTFNTFFSNLQIIENKFYRICITFIIQDLYNIYYLVMDIYSLPGKRRLCNWMDRFKFNLALNTLENFYLYVRSMMLLLKIIDCMLSQDAEKYQVFFFNK